MMNSGVYVFKVSNTLKCEVLNLEYIVNKSRLIAHDWNKNICSHLTHLSNKVSSLSQSKPNVFLGNIN